MKNRGFIVFVLFFVIGSSIVLANEFENVKGMQDKINEYKSLAIPSAGGISYNNLAVYSLDPGMPSKALYHEALGYRYLAVYKSDYEIVNIETIGVINGRLKLKTSNILKNIPKLENIIEDSENSCKAVLEFKLCKNSKRTCESKDYNNLGERTSKLKIPGCTFDNNNNIVQVKKIPDAKTIIIGFNNEDITLIKEASGYYTTDKPIKINDEDWIVKVTNLYSTTEAGPFIYLEFTRVGGETLKTSSTSSEEVPSGYPSISNKNKISEASCLINIQPKTEILNLEDCNLVDKEGQNGIFIKTDISNNKDVLTLIYQTFDNGNLLNNNFNTDKTEDDNFFLINNKEDIFTSSISIKNTKNKNEDWKVIAREVNGKIQIKFVNIDVQNSLIADANKNFRPIKISSSEDKDYTASFIFSGGEWKFCRSDCKSRDIEDINFIEVNRFYSDIINIIMEKNFEGNFREGIKIILQYIITNNKDIKIITLPTDEKETKIEIKEEGIYLNDGDSYYYTISEWIKLIEPIALALKTGVQLNVKTVGGDLKEVQKETSENYYQIKASTKDQFFNIADVNKVIYQFIDGEWKFCKLGYFSLDRSCDKADMLVIDGNNINSVNTGEVHKKILDEIINKRVKRDLERGIEIIYDNIIIENGGNIVLLLENNEILIKENSDLSERVNVGNLAPLFKTADKDKVIRYIIGYIKKQ